MSGFVIDKEKVEALAKGSHNCCHGTGIYGYAPGSTQIVLCRCVWRALKIKGIEPRDFQAVKKAIGREEAKPA